MASKRNRKKTGKKKKIINKKTSTGKRFISSVVIDALEENPEADDESIIAKAKKEFPDSAINKLHVSWYRHRFSKKLLPKQLGYKKPDQVTGKSTKKSKKKISKKKASKKKVLKKKKTSKKKTTKRKRKAA